jgi:hypothetical protein
MGLGCCSLPRPVSHPALQENEAPVDDIEDVVLSNQDEKRRVEHWKKLDKLQGFKKYRRKTDPYRDPSRRVKDWDEINRRQKVCWLATYPL